MPYLVHGAKGREWKKHKYIRKEGNRYIYTDEFRDKEGNVVYRRERHREVDPNDYFRTRHEMNKIKKQYNKDLRDNVREIERQHVEEGSKSNLVDRGLSYSMNKPGSSVNKNVKMVNEGMWDGIAWWLRIFKPNDEVVKAVDAKDAINDINKTIEKARDRRLSDVKKEIEIKKSEEEKKRKEYEENREKNLKEFRNKKFNEKHDGTLGRFLHTWFGINIYGD